MCVRLAQTDKEIQACFRVMQELRTALQETEFVPKIRQLEETGYSLAYLTQDEKIVAVAGFRLGESLAWKRYLYVDDLVTLHRERSKGYGATLLNWLKEFAVQAGCEQLHLDSGVQRKDAHRFYEREAMQRTSYHYAISLHQPELQLTSKR